MANFYYIDYDGLKQGPYSGGQIKQLAESGYITPDTIIENQEGKQTPAGKAKGLEFTSYVYDYPVDTGLLSYTYAPPVKANSRSSIETTSVPAPSVEQTDIDTFFVDYDNFLKSIRGTVEEDFWANAVAPLILAADTGNIEIVKHLVSQGVDVNGKLRGGCTPLHAAALDGRVEVAKFLISMGAEIDAKDDVGFTPLDTAKQSGKMDMVQYLTSIGATSNMALVLANPNEQKNKGKRSSPTENSISSRVPEMLAAIILLVLVDSNFSPLLKTILFVFFVVLVVLYVVFVPSVIVLANWRVKTTKQRCCHLGGIFIFWGSLLSFLAVFLLGWFGDTPVDTPKGLFLLSIFYIMLGIGGFMLSAGPILLVVGVIMPDQNKS